MLWTSNQASLRRARFWIPAGIFVFLLRLLIWAQTAPAPVSAPTQTPTMQSPASAPSVPSPPSPLVMIDPAHGGAESGAVLNPAILEKDVTLALARRLRQDLGARGISAELVRDGDLTLSTDQRAAKVNSERPNLYICVHATSQGAGVRVYSAMLPEGGGNRSPFADWETAQSASLMSSRSAQEQLVAAIQKSGIPVRSLPAALRPLNNVTVAALAIEIAPTAADVSQLASADYQQTVSVALANGIASTLSSLRTPVAATP